MIYGIIYSNACGRNSFKVSSIIPMKDKNPIVVVSGQHHLSALKQYADSLQDKYDMLDKKQMKIINMAKPLMYHVQQHNEYQALQEDLRWVLDNIGQWDMIIYNQGKHLSVVIMYFQLCACVYTCRTSVCHILSMQSTYDKACPCREPFHAQIMIH